MPEPQPPSVLAVLVAKDGARWLKRCLSALAGQTYPRLGVLAVDDGSADDSLRLLRRLLGEERVLANDRRRGFPAAVGRALETSLVEEADYLLLIHDDAVLAPDAVSRLVEAADGGEDVGVVGPKVVDLEDPRLLLEVGVTIDRLGYPASPIEEGEIDQGQYDSPREVLSVSSTAMLVARGVWARAGHLDDRLRPCHGDVDFCWRVRAAGFRVFMEPGALVAHGMAGERGERPGSRPDRARYYGERARLTSLLKSYRLLTLLWVLPAFFAQGLARVLATLVARRFSHAGQIVAAWGWALLRLPGTAARRLRLRSARRVPEREITRFMAPATTTLRRWLARASSAIFPARAAAPDLDEEAPEIRFRERMGGLVATHPVGSAVSIAIVLALVAFRDVIFVSPLEGGVIPLFPQRAVDLFGAFGQRWAPLGFGGPGGGSPALVPLGLAGIITLGNAQHLGWLLTVATPFLAGASAYRALLRHAGERGPSLAAGACYGLSAVALWTVSEGRIDAMAFLVALPWLASRVARAFGQPVPWFRWVVGTGFVLGVTGSFLPAVWAPLAVVAVLAAVFARDVDAALRGVALTLAATAVAAVLVFPFTIQLLRADGGQPADVGAGSDIWALLRLSLGPAPGAWVAAFFLPIAGTLGLALAGRRDRRVAWAAAIATAVSIPLAWLATAGYLPPPLSDPVAFLSLAAFSLSFLVGLAFAAVGPGVERRAFGRGQLALGVLIIVVAGGLALQSASAVRGRWAVGEDRLPPAWPVVATSDPAFASRVLWLGEVGRGAFAPPGGEPQGFIEAGDASVRYALTGRQGVLADSLALPVAGPGYENLNRVLVALVSGEVRHGGSLLAPMGVAFVVAAPGDLPESVVERLNEQLDLLLVQRTGGLVIYRNTRPLAVASAIPGEGVRENARRSDLLAPAQVPAFQADPLEPVDETDWRARVDLEEPGVVLLGMSFDDRWHLEADGAAIDAAFPAFGWGVGFDAPAGPYEARVVYEGRSARKGQVAAMVALWAAALVVTRWRRPSR